MLGFSAYDANNIGASATGTGWFGPMGTAAAARGRGVGAVLLKRCLADMAAQGHAVSTIPWVAPVGFYAHHVGAHISRVFYRYEKRVVVCPAVLGGLSRTAPPVLVACVLANSAPRSVPLRLEGDSFG